MKKFVLPWQAHPHRDQAWYDAQAERMTQDELARELDRNYELSVRGRVFDMFHEHLHVTHAVPRINPSRPVYRIWDFGRTNATLYGQIDGQGRRIVLFERVLGGKGQAGSTTSQQIQIARDDSAAQFAGCTFIDICDPAGSYPDQRGNDTDVSLLMAEAISPHYEQIRSTPTIDRKKRAIKAVTADLERLIEGSPALQLVAPSAHYEGCPVLRDAFLFGYRYKTDLAGQPTPTIIEEHPFEDVMDCLLYWYLETKHTALDSLEAHLFRPQYTHKVRNDYTGY